MARPAGKGWRKRHRRAAALGTGRGSRSPVWLAHGDNPVRLVRFWYEANKIAEAEFQATGRMLRILTRGDMLALLYRR